MSATKFVKVVGIVICLLVFAGATGLAVNTALLQTGSVPGNVIDILIFVFVAMLVAILAIANVDDYTQT